MTSSMYAALKRRIAPQLRYSQSIFEEILERHVSSRSVWLDAGCGKNTLPSWRTRAEAELFDRAALVVGCDLSHTSLTARQSLWGHLCVGDLERLPFQSGSLNLITCNMVIEHLREPVPVLREFERILRPGGTVIIHTPNTRSHFVLGARLLPRKLKQRLARRLDGRAEDDVFPAYYRANTQRRLRAASEAAGLSVRSVHMVASDAVFATASLLLAALELMWIRLTLSAPLRSLRTSMIFVLEKRAIVCDFNGAGSETSRRVERQLSTGARPSRSGVRRAIQRSLTAIAATPSDTQTVAVVASGHGLTPRSMDRWRSLKSGR